MDFKNLMTAAQAREAVEASRRREYERKIAETYARPFEIIREHAEAGMNQAFIPRPKQDFVLEFCGFKKWFWYGLWPTDVRSGATLTLIDMLRSKGYEVELSKDLVPRPGLLVRW